MSTQVILFYVGNLIAKSCHNTCVRIHFAPNLRYHSKAFLFDSPQVRPMIYDPSRSMVKSPSSIVVELGSFCHREPFSDRRPSLCLRQRHQCYCPLGISWNEVLRSERLPPVVPVRIFPSRPLFYNVSALMEG